MSDTPPTPSARIHQLPNILTIARIFFAIFLLFFLLHHHIILPAWVHESWVNYFACLLFCLAALTDFFDGYIARKFRLESTFGAVFDPLADKMLILSAFIALLLLHRADAWAVFIILSREFFITGLRAVVASSGKSLAASWLGKYKTGAQILAIAFLLLDILPGASVLLWIAAIITLYSGIDYSMKYYAYYKSMK